MGVGSSNYTLYTCLKLSKNRFNSLKPIDAERETFKDLGDYDENSVLLFH